MLENKVRSSSARTGSALKDWTISPTQYKASLKVNSSDLYDFPPLLLLLTFLRCFLLFVCLFIFPDFPYLSERSTRNPWVPIHSTIFFWRAHFLSSSFLMIFHPLGVPVGWFRESKWHSLLYPYLRCGRCWVFLSYYFLLIYNSSLSHLFSPHQLRAHAGGSRCAAWISGSIHSLIASLLRRLGNQGGWKLI